MKSITIIGGGLGGLTSGALLAKQGYSVTLLEQHNIVGGSATTFKRKGGFTCEVGLHEIDSVFNDGSKKEIFEALGVYEHIEFVRPNEFFRVKAKNFDITLPDNRQEAITLLSQRYPQDRRAIEHYFKLIEMTAHEFSHLGHAQWWEYLLFPWTFRHIMKYRKASVKEVLDELTKNEALKLILNTNIGYYNDKISTFSFLYHAIAQHSYFSGGGWYIKGGSQKLSDHLASIIKANGGKVITKANVIGIEHNNNMALSVVYEYKKERHEIFSDTVISNLAPFKTHELAKLEDKEDKKVASSLLSIYIGFNQNLKSIYGKGAYSTFMFSQTNSVEVYDYYVESDIKERNFVFVDYSQIDSGLVSNDKSFGVICTTDYLSDWENLSKEDYKAKKVEILESYLNVLEQEYPNIRDYIAFAEVGTAKTMQHYLRTPQGTAYGFAPTAEQFLRIPKVKSDKLKNLYFVGAWVLGGGFTPAILSGGMCAKAIQDKGKS